MPTARTRSAPDWIDRVAKTMFWVFVAALLIQLGHFVEHVVQIHQLIWFANPRPRGLLGAWFDFPMVHFVYNAALFVTILWCYVLWLTYPGIWRPSKWGAWSFHALAALQGYHVVEHVVQMFQHFHNHLQFPPGILGQHVPGVLLHFDFNGLVTLLMLLVLAGFWPSPKAHDPETAVAAWRGRAGRLQRLPGGAFATGVWGSGTVSAALVAILVFFAQTAPAAQIVPVAEEHCVGQPKDRAEKTTTDWSFTDVTQAAGIRHVVGEGLPPMGRLGLAGITAAYSTEETHPMRSLVGGVAVADVDGDGWQDFLVVDAGPDSLWRNRGDGTFEDATARSGLGDPASGRSAVFFDYDADGDADVYVANIEAPSRLWRNDGDLRFTDVTDEAGVNRTSSAHGAFVADVDGDGDLDLSVANYGPWQVHGAELQADAENGEQDFLFINQGDGTFREEASLRGFTERKWSFSHAWADFDGDGDQDLYHNVDFGVDDLFVNDGQGRFRESARSLGAFTDGNGMGAVWVDYDDDLDLDLFATNIHVACNRDVPQFTGNDLFRNDGGRFTDVAADVGIADGMWGWDSEWADFDLDGDQDAFQANGYSTRGEVDRYHDALVYLSDDAPRQLTTRNQGEQPSLAYQKYNATSYVVWSFYPPLAKGQVDDSSQGGHQVDRFWVNDGGRFRDAAASVGFTEWEDGRAAAAIDFDNDGDLDLLRTAWQRPVQLLENPASENGRHWLKVDLVGPAGNPDAVGAIVTLRAGDVEALRHATASGGFMSQSESLLHFGLGENSGAQEIVVRWPDGKETRLTDVPGNQVLRIVHPG